METHGNYVDPMLFGTYTGIDNSQTNFTDIDRVVIASAALSVGVDEGRVLPCSRKAAIVEKNITLFEL